MSSTDEIGQSYVVEADALRIAVLVHQLGARGDGRWFLDMESQVQALDHLLRHPIDLAYTLLDQIEARRDEFPEHSLPPLAARLRRLLFAGSSQRRRQGLLQPFEPGLWERWDAPLAYLACRNLLRVATRSSRDLRYLLTDAGVIWLEDEVYPSISSLEPTLERCSLIREVMPEPVIRPKDEPMLDKILQDISNRLTAFRLDEQLPLEEDMLSRLFQAIFLEPL